MSSSESKRNIDEISSEMKGDGDRIGSMARFGYFSIPYSATLGDRYYSQDRQKIYRTSERKVITEQRGIYTNPTKKGKFADAYFSNAFKEERDTLNRIKELSEKEKVDYLAIVKGRKKGAENPDKAFRVNFKPSGPHEYKDLLDINPVHYEIPITKEIDKKLKIDKDKKSVFTEKRGVYTNPPKKGTSSTPGVLFNYFREEKKIQDSRDKSNDKARSKSAEKGEFKQAFKPASLMKNEPFQKDGELYGEEDKNINELLQNAIDLRHKGNPKFVKKLPPGAVQQAFAFRPPALVKTGRETLFKPVYGVPFTGHEKVPIVKKSKDEKAFKKEFTYNRLVDSSVFSPPVTSYLTNLKKEFPRVFHK